MSETDKHSAPAPARRGKEMFAMVLVLAAATFIAYFPSLSGELIWNDLDYVTKPALRSLAGLGQIWIQPGATEQYYPLLHSAFWLQCRLWGEHPLGYHLVTIILHVVAAVLFARVLQRLGVPGAWLAAFIFALHPVHVQSVAWITEQKNTLSLVFYLGAAFVYLRFDETRKRRDYFEALGLFVLSLFCKTVTASLPAALLVVFWWKRGRVDPRRDIRPLLAWFAVAVTMGLFTSWVERFYVGARGESFELSFLERGLVAGRAFWFYLSQIAWPAQLNFIYHRWTPDVSSLGQWLCLLGALALAAGLWALRGRNRAPLAVCLLFAGSLFPVLGFVNLYGALYSWVWDHWQYLPDLGLIALLAAGLTQAWSAVSLRTRMLGPVGAGLLILLLGTLSWRHAKIFHDDITLFRTTLSRNPECWMAHYNLGCLLVKTPGGTPEAINHFQDTLRLKPGYAGAHINLGMVLAEKPGQSAEAMAHFEAATRSEPTNIKAWYNLANLLAQDPARTNEAIAKYEHTLEINPAFADAHTNLGRLLATLPTRKAAALPHFEAALTLEPDSASAHNNLGNFLAELPGRIPDAISHLETALRLDPGFAEAHYNLANILIRAPQRRSDAINHYETVLRLNPEHASAHINLGIALADTPGRESEAITHFEAATRLEPKNPSARLNLGIALAPFPKRLPEAIAELSTAVRLDPSSADAHFSLGVVLLRAQRTAEAHAEFETAVRLRPAWTQARQLAEQTRP